MAKDWKEVKKSAKKWKIIFLAEDLKKLGIAEAKTMEVANEIRAKLRLEPFEQKNTNSKTAIVARLKEKGIKVPADAKTGDILKLAKEHLF